MKKALFLGALAAMLLGTASCSKDIEPEMTDGTVQFKVELPGNIDSRAISDGTTAKKLDVACYDADGNVLTTLNPTVSDFENRVATVTVKLVKGQKYQFAFFAHAAGAPYAFNAGTKLSECNFTVTDNYTGENCLSNAENRDAFYATLTGYEVTSATTEVTLHRPFAQLNFGTDDLAAAEAAGIIPGQSMVTVKQVATSFNLSTGATTGAVDATFALANRPTEKLNVDKEYDWMAMNYFLVPNNEANVDVEMTVKTADKNGTAREDVVVPVNSVPVKKNHRTNILGSLFTQEGNFKVIIEPAFDTPDYNVEPINPIEVRTNEELLAALYTTDKKNISIKLMNDISNFEIGARTAWGNDVLESLTIDGNGHRLGFWLKDSDWNSFGTKNDADLIIKNITLGVDTRKTTSQTWNTWAMNIKNYTGLEGHDGEESTVSKVTMKNVICESSISVTQDATFENVTFKETTEHYTLIIMADVKNVNVKDCSFIATNNGRGIKVSDQYVDKNDRQKINITVSGTTFSTQKKAAILLSNTAGANINWQSGNDISMVAKDQINAVWVDKDNCAHSGEGSDFYSNYQDQVTCTGCTFIVEP